MDRWTLLFCNMQGITLLRSPSFVSSPMLKTLQCTEVPPITLLHAKDHTKASHILHHPQNRIMSTLDTKELLNHRSSTSRAYECRRRDVILLAIAVLVACSGDLNTVLRVKITALDRVLVSLENTLEERTLETVSVRLAFLNSLGAFWQSYFVLAMFYQAVSHFISLHFAFRRDWHMCSLHHISSLGDRIGSHSCNTSLIH